MKSPETDYSGQPGQPPLVEQTGENKTDERKTGEK